MARNLFILNDRPYGTERSYNALRLAGALEQLTDWTTWAEKTLVF